ncbi:MAG: hypothetical protein HY318_19350 [Armatimonadetes bacterium]|nr:hypothetical protein [Armatimonadota bacterium]
MKTLGLAVVVLMLGVGRAALAAVPAGDADSPEPGRASKRGFFAQADVMAVVAPEPVMTQILGTSLDYRNPPLKGAVIEQALIDLSTMGLALSWDASPAPWTQGLLENQEQLSYCRAMAMRLVQHGMGGVFVFPWNRLLPVKPVDREVTWCGETLHPVTGAFETDPENPQWNFGSAVAKAAFEARSKALFQAVGPFHMFLSDEQIMASPGGNSPHVNRMSAYWTSPTYSTAALGSTDAPGSFRHYLAAVGYPQAATTKFPVTTVEVAANQRANMGLPAVPLNDGNSDRLQSDNSWPEGTLWKHWYGWRTEVYKEWVDAVTTAAHETWGHQPNWQGCAFAAPYYWYDPALGLDVDKIASLRHVDYMVAGYFSGMNFRAVRDAALRHGKKWGGMVELSHYGQREGVSPQALIDTFKANVESGASLMLVYAGANFRSDQGDPNDTGAYFMPAQVAAWKECIKWLEEGRKVKRIVGQP